MKKLSFLIIVLVSFSSFADVPSWLTKADKLYPAAEYVKAIGEGTSIKTAQNQAISQISLFFDTKSEVVAEALKKSEAVLEDGRSVFSMSQSLKQNIKISSEADFFCVQFTDAYYSKKSDRYSVLAYINKENAAKVYNSRISAMMEAVKSYRNYAQSSDEPFLAASALHKADVISKIAEKYIHNETLLVPLDTAKWQESLRTISLIPAEHNAIKRNVTFSILLNQKEKVFDPIFSTVASILEKQGFAYSVADSNYKIILDISCVEESYDAGDFVRPLVDVLIVNRAGSGVYTYSKALPRIGSKNMEQAYTRAVTKIKQDLEENFLAE